MDVMLPPTGDVDVLHWLDEETRVHRARLERHARLAALLAPSVTPGAYLDVLARALGFCAPLELALSRVPRFGLHPTRAPLIARDLLALGLPEPALGGLPLCPSVPALSTAGRALGSRFVLESYPVGGAVALRHLARTLGVTPARGGAFFTAADALPRWRHLGHDVRAFVVRGGSLDEVTAGATEAYDALHAWMDA
jgi:heme oxygenase (biliverdin-IX-beta and delta-forming)